MRNRAKQVKQTKTERPERGKGDPRRSLKAGQGFSKAGEQADRGAFKESGCTPEKGQANA